MVAIDVIQASGHITVRDITITVTDSVDIGKITDAVKNLKGVRLVNVSDRTFLLHLGGKIETQPKIPIQNRDDLSRVYTPDVARVCAAIQEDPKKPLRSRSKEIRWPSSRMEAPCSVWAISALMRPCR